MKPVIITPCEINNASEGKDPVDQPMAELVESTGVETPLSNEELEKWSFPWKKTLIVNVMGKSINFKNLKLAKKVGQERFH